MNVSAAIAYLRALREARRIGQSEVARAANVEGKQVYRWEAGENEPSISGFAAYLQTVKGSWADVGALIGDEKADASTARKRAEAWLASLEEGERVTIEARVDATPVDRRARIADELRRLAEDIEQGRSGLP